jgi:phosphate transport system protein
MDDDLHPSAHRATPDATPSRPLRGDYAQRLDELDDRFVETALLVAEVLPEVAVGLSAADPSRAERLRAVESDVRERCRAIEEDCLTLLALEAPVSHDLRRLVSLLAMVVDVVRSVTHARQVAEAPAHLDPAALPADLRRDLAELAMRSADVYRAGLDAWRRRDALAVHEIVRADDEVDRLRTRVIVGARTAEGSVDDLVTLSMVGRAFERLADHGVALAQNATFAATGVRVDD